MSRSICPAAVDNRSTSSAELRSAAMAVAANFVGQRLQHVGAATGEDELGAAGVQRAGDRLAQAAGRTGDQGAGAVQGESVRSSGSLSGGEGGEPVDVASGRAEQLPLPCARLKYRWASCSQVIAMPPCSWIVSAGDREERLGAVRLGDGRRHRRRRPRRRRPTGRPRASTCRSAIRCLSAWKLPIGRPNCMRTLGTRRSSRGCAAAAPTCSADSATHAASSAVRQRAVASAGPIRRAGRAVEPDRAPAAGSDPSPGCARVARRGRVDLEARAARPGDHEQHVGDVAVEHVVRRRRSAAPPAA